MDSIGFRILPRLATDPRLVALFAGLPASIASIAEHRYDDAWIDGILRAKGGVAR